ncbi:MAG: cupin domain-containing protein, partial [Tannerella sp.]|nr:cupin domain-containing protein [Tannerella sp.]
MQAKIQLSIVLLLIAVNVMSQHRQQAIPGQIETCINRFQLRSSDKNGNGWAHYYIPKGMGDTLTVKMSCVYVGRQTHAPHVHNEDEAFYIIRGPVNFHINGEERILHTGDFVYTPGKSSHNIQRVNETDTIKYLVIKRETVKDVDTPRSTGKANYTMDDCCHYPANDSAWADRKNAASVKLLDKAFADGFQIVMERVTNRKKVFQNANPRNAGQTAIYVLSGEADVTLDGQRARLYADNTFYCPKQS